MDCTFFVSSPRFVGRHIAAYCTREHTHPPSARSADFSKFLRLQRNCQSGHILCTRHISRNPPCDSPHPPHPHPLRYGCSGQATVYLASRTYGRCLTIRTGPREPRSQRLHVAERSATEFIELYASTTPMHNSHYSTPHSYSPTGRKCMTSKSEITVAHLLLS